MSGWTAIAGNSNYPSVTIEGNGHTLRNLPAPLFKNVPGRDYTFSNLTVDGANFALVDNVIFDDGFAGAFVGEFQNNGGGKITIDNCHVKNSTMSDYKHAGGFIGYATTGSTSAIEIKNSTVTDTTLNTADSSCGAFIGHTCTATTLTNCKVLGSTNVKCDVNRGGGAAKAGWFVGTVNGGLTTFTGCTNSSTGTLTNVSALAPLANDFVGRNVGGSLTVNGIVIG